MTYVTRDVRRRGSDGGGPTVAAWCLDAMTPTYVGALEDLPPGGNMVFRLTFK
jgi:hypothetical protein